MNTAWLVTNPPNFITVKMVALEDPHFDFIAQVQSSKISDFTARIPALRIRSWVLGAAKILLASHPNMD